MVVFRTFLGGEVIEESRLVICSVRSLIDEFGLLNFCGVAYCFDELSVLGVC